MSSFTYLSKAVVAATTIGSAGEVVHHIRRLSSSSSEEERQWSPFKNEFQVLLVVFGVGIVTLAVGVLIVHFLFRCFKGHQINQLASFQPGTRRISPLMAIGPALTYTNGLTLAGRTYRPECMICLSEFVEGDENRILSNCRHGFHLKCNETWLQSSRSSSCDSCPTCRSCCVKTSVNQNLPEQQQPNDVDLEAANLPEVEMVVLQQQQQNDAHEAANLPESEIVVLHQQQQQRTEY